MKILVTGGAGFIGSNLVKRLVFDGHDVTILDNLSSGYRSNIDAFSDVRFIEGDIRDQRAIAIAVQGIEVIFHMAASVGNKRSIDHPVTDAEINVIGTVQLLEAACQAGVRKIVSSSSAGIFGELKTLPIREDHPVEPDSPYGCTKLCQEKLCLAYAKLYQLEAICLRYFNVYGPNQRFDAYGNVIPILVFRMLRGEPLTIFGDGEQTRDFINVRDVVQANIKAAMAHGISGVFNLGSANAVSINQLVEIIARISGLTPKVRYCPPRPGDVRHSLADITAVKAAVGFHPSVLFEDGLSEYIAWAKEEVLNSCKR